MVSECYVVSLNTHASFVSCAVRKMLLPFFS